ncbi:MAG: hypothetical protein ACKO2V_25670, partial [Snowella sp.]
MLVFPCFFTISEKVNAVTTVILGDGVTADENVDNVTPRTTYTNIRNTTGETAYDFHFIYTQGSQTLV